MHLQLTTNAFPPELVAEAAAMWPHRAWPGWFWYNTPDQRKGACWKWEIFPEPCARLLAMMVAKCPAHGVTPDLSLYGGGLHLMLPGDYVRPHLDADAHKLIGLERRHSTMLYLSDCEGGELKIAGATIRPYPGLWLSFECTDDAIHEVTEVTGGERKSLAMFWFGGLATERKRERAAFLT